ncbi:FAD-dependent oxidoreductase [Corynebacterium aquilae]|uniref:CoA-disulfide reductase n=1 Tax=Corynebacterium aquilae DSM 44791 TaxID=1431546 RepID=A0A1L7CHV9_9CORY|nr:FAD-dependent oxidoreductase [Corynebacterium aquilae]APT85446.1 CoA-disulfide reductase [Corynebacterium aquilae DSM 44791]
MDSNTTRIVIVGGVAGGMSAATRLRRLMEDAEIIVVEKGQYVSFANCGLPYYAGGVIADRGALLLQTPESLKARFNLDVRVGTEATAIDADAKTLTVSTAHGEETIAYDALLLAPGAKPFLPPIPGIERAKSLRNIDDVDQLVGVLDDKPKTAVIMGGGFIGLELAENLHARGIAVTLVEAAPQILAPLDEEMAAMVDNHLVEMGVAVRTGQMATGITDTHVQLDNGEELPADLVVAAVGVRADTELAKNAGIELDQRGGILVDEQHRTNLADVYAVGDAVAKRDRLDNASVHVPLANSANRDGRTVADIIAGLAPATELAGRAGDADSRGRIGVLGTAIVGVGGLVAACTGWNERTAKARGVNYRTIHTHPFNHATYYPGATQMSLKLVFDADTYRILGAQAVGREGVDKRIDVLATAIAGGLKVTDLAGIDLAYAPQFGLAKDPVTMLGFVADNMLAGVSDTVDIFTMDTMVADGHKILDVRTPGEYAAGNIPGATNIELDALRDNIEAIRELAGGKDLIVHCAVGVRGHSAVCLLAGYGIGAKNLAGGYKTWAAMDAKRQRSA